jgi:hypothetical protein
MAAGLFIAADKYLPDGLKNESVLLLLHGDLQNPAEPLKEATKISPALSK